MDTSAYFFAGYAVFWLLPTVYLFRLVRRLSELEQRVDAALKSAAS